MAIKMAELTGVYKALRANWETFVTRLNIRKPEEDLENEYFVYLFGRKLLIAFSFNDGEGYIAYGYMCPSTATTRQYTKIYVVCSLGMETGGNIVVLDKNGKPSEPTDDTAVASDSLKGFHERQLLKIYKGFPKPYSHLE